MRQFIHWGLSLCVALLLATTSRAQVNDDAVNASLRDAVRYLKSKQQANGSWPDAEYPNFPAGVSALCTLALLNAGEDVESPHMRRALNYVRAQRNLADTYTVALQTIVLCTASPEEDQPRILENAQWLANAQRTGATGDVAGSWTYDQRNSNDGDPSNAQFALLALYEAERAGIEVKDSTWRLALAYWKRLQRESGAFGYNSVAPATGSMTCAGIGSMIICSGQVAELDAQIGADGNVQCCQSGNETDDSIEMAFAWLGKHFAVSKNPRATTTSAQESRLYYYLYALERVGRLAGRRFIGGHDWYREGAEFLVGRQDELSGFWINAKKHTLTPTAFAVLFLSKGRRPVLMSKLQRDPQDDWNHHRHDIAHLTRHVEKRWKQDLTWQVVDLSAATLTDLWQSPILFLSGSKGLALLQEQKESLREYVANGGFLFAENCCDDGAFDRDFRALMEELFPDSPLRLLLPEHPVWYAEQTVDPRFLRPLLGIDACCRTGVVYSPEKLSCYWELAVPERAARKLTPDLAAEIEACLAIGANVVTYATGRQLRDKLDVSGLVSVVTSNVSRDRTSLLVAKLQHGGGGDEAPSALTNVLATLAAQTQLPVSVEKRLLAPTDPNLPDYPIAFVHGRRSFSWSAPERRALRAFILQGGVLFADAICANAEFAQSFREEMAALFPQRPIRPIPASHPMFTPAFAGHDVTRVAFREPRKRGGRNDRLQQREQQIQPRLEGIEIDGRFVVIFSPFDMSCALENRPSLECAGYTRADAAKLATNILLYAMQQ